MPRENENCLDEICEEVRNAQRYLKRYCPEFGLLRAVEINDGWIFLYVDDLVRADIWDEDSHQTLKNYSDKIRSAADGMATMGL